MYGNSMTAADAKKNEASRQHATIRKAVNLNLVNNQRSFSQISHRKDEFDFARLF